MRSTSPQLRVCDLVGAYGFTPRYWVRLARTGKIRGARQPSGYRGGWTFDRDKFLEYAKLVGLVAEQVELEPPPARTRKPLRRSTPTDLVYAIYSVGHIKFGVSSNVTRRSYSFSTASPAPIVLLATVKGSNDLELGIQRRLEAARAVGEWFRITPEVRSFVLQMQREGTACGSLEEAEKQFRQWLTELPV